MVLGVDTIILAVIAIASFLASILIIWSFASKIKSSLNTTIKAVLATELIDMKLQDKECKLAADEKLAIALKTADEKTALALKMSDEKIALALRVSDEKVSSAFLAAQERTDLQFKSIKEELSADRAKEAELQQRNSAFSNVMADALIESYKNDIRGIYYVLRATGELTDHDKAYVDKIFPLYKALGGNSDVEAKYNEMCKVFERRTQEAFDAARAKKAKDKAEKESN